MIMPKVETLNKKPESEPMDSEVTEENKRSETSVDDIKPDEEVPDVQTEQTNEKSPGVHDKQNDNEKPETTDVKNKEADVEEKYKDESQVNAITEAITNNDGESKTEPINKEVKHTTNEISPDTNTIPTPKNIVKTINPNECFPSVENVDRLKAMFPELEIVHKEISTPAIDKLPAHKPLQQIDQAVAHILATSYQDPIKWSKEHALAVRLQHIVECVETGEWPVSKKFSDHAQNPSICNVGMEETDVTVSKRDIGVPHDHISLSEIHNEHSNLKSNNIMAHTNPYLKRERHIAIEVETERAKLHALLNTNPIPAHPIKHSPAPMWEQTDKSLSEDSRRSTSETPLLIQPPPAHQQSHNISSRLINTVLNNPKTPTTVTATTTQSTGPIDLSSGGGTQMDCMDLSSGPRTNPSSSPNEALDFSMPFKNKLYQNVTQTPSCTIPKKQIGDMLNKLIQKKNFIRTSQLSDEPVVGKEMKRRELDKIVFGLSAAKEQQSIPSSSEQEKYVASTSAAQNYQTPNKSQQNLTQQIGVVHRQSSKLDPLAAFLSSQVYEQQSNLLQQHTTLQQQLAQQQQVLKMAQVSSASSVTQTQRKMYEAMMDSMAKSTADFSGKLSASTFSQEAEINMLSAEPNALMTDQTLSADFLPAPRRRRPRVNPTLLDWEKLTGEENVSVINRTTGKKLTGTKAPQLKIIGQWLLENPAYDVDPIWADLVKECGNLTHDLQKRLPQTKRKKGPGRPPLQTEENTSSSCQSLSSNQLSTSMAPNLSFPSLASAGLGGLNPSTLLSNLAMGNFDPKNNPLLMPFSGLPDIGALGSMGELSNMNLTNSFFANLAGLGLPGLADMDPSSMNNRSYSTQNAQSNTDSSKSRKSESNSKNTLSSSANVPSSLPGSLPFFFPNPSLLYTPLDLGGLNPFSLQPEAISSAYDSLSLLNGSLNVSSPNTYQNSPSHHKTSISLGQNSNVSTVTTSSQRHPKISTHHLPSPTQNSADLENLSRAGCNLPPPDLSKSRSSRDVNNYRSLMSSIPQFNVLEAGALTSDSDSEKTREQDIRETLGNLSKTSPELFVQSLPDDKKFSFPSMETIEKFLKRPAEQTTSTERPNKRAKDMMSPITTPVSPTMTELPSTSRDSSSESDIDVSDSIKAEFPEKQCEKIKKVDIPQPTVSSADIECDSQLFDKFDAESVDMIKPKSDYVDDNDDKNNSKNRKRCRTKKTSFDENVERKNLRSHACRDAAAATTWTQPHSPPPPPPPAEAAAE